MSILQTTLAGMRNGCRSVRAKLAREIDLHLTPIRERAHEAFRESGRESGIPYVDRALDGLRDAVLSGSDVALVDLVDTRADDISAETAACVWNDVAGYLGSIGLWCGREWRWHDEARRSGVVILTVPL